MNKFKFLTLILLAGIILFSNNFIVNASEVDVNENIEVSPYAVSDGATFWQIESKPYIGISYGSYRNGPQASGGTISLSKASTTSMQYEHKLEGSIGDKNKISQSFGVTFGKSYTKTSSYSITVPQGQTRRIIYRPYYKKYKVIERKYYRMDGKSHKTNETKTSYVYIFQDWDCTWKSI